MIALMRNNPMLRSSWWFGIRIKHAKVNEPVTPKEFEHRLEAHFRQDKKFVLRARGNGRHRDHACFQHVPRDTILDRIRLPIDAENSGQRCAWLKSQFARQRGSNKGHGHSSLWLPTPWMGRRDEPPLVGVCLRLLFEKACAHGLGAIQLS